MAKYPARITPYVMLYILVDGYNKHKVELQLLTFKRKINKY